MKMIGSESQRSQYLFSKSVASLREVPQGYLFELFERSVPLGISNSENTNCKCIVGQL